MPKMLLIFFHLQYIKMAIQKFTNFYKFLKIYIDMTAVTIQPNKIVSNEVKNN